MIDRIFTAALTFFLLAAGTLAVGSALFESAAPRVVPQVVQLPQVDVIGKRTDAGTAWAQTEGSEPATRKVQ